MFFTSQGFWYAFFPRLVDPSVDPKYAATGGKLEVPRVGMTAEEIFAELEVSL